MQSNRENNIRRDNDTYKNISITIKDIDNAILTHIKNTIKPTVTENGIDRIVPVYFADPSIWNSVQKLGYLRDQKTSQIMVPALVIKNKGLSKNINMPVDKLDGNLRKTIYKKYSNKNKYDVFNVLNNIKLQEEYYSVTIPDYIIVNYQIQIWTAYINHMNNIIEKFIYAENSYWGNEHYKFRTYYDSINVDTDIQDGENRTIKCIIDANVSAYILPESFDSKNTTVKQLSPAKVVIKTETVLDDINKVTENKSIPIKFE